MLKDAGFGEIVQDFLPPDLRERAHEAGINLRGVAESVRSLTIRARRAL